MSAFVLSCPSGRGVQLNALRPHPPLSPLSLVRERGEGSFRMEMGIRVEILGMGSDSVEFPLSRSMGEGDRG